MDGPVEGKNFRALKIATIVMGVLILLGTTVLIVTVIKRSGGQTPVARVEPQAWDKPYAAVVDEPAGTAIVSVTTVRDRLALQLRGGGPDRVVLVDPATGGIVGRVTVGH